jgi:hypothetical protein
MLGGRHGWKKMLCADAKLRLFILSSVIQGHGLTVFSTELAAQAANSVLSLLIRKLRTQMQEHLLGHANLLTKRYRK